MDLPSSAWIQFRISTIIRMADLDQKRVGIVKVKVFTIIFIDLLGIVNCDCFFQPRVFSKVNVLLKDKLNKRRATLT
jgi:hypothetical protein